MATLMLFLVAPLVTRQGRSVAGEGGRGVVNWCSPSPLSLILCINYSVL